MSSDRELDRKSFNGHTIVLLEDQNPRLRNPDGTSGQYVIAVESISKKGNVNLSHRRYISNLIRKKGYANAKEGALAVFHTPHNFMGVLGEGWLPYTQKADTPQDRGSMRTTGA